MKCCCSTSPRLVQKYTAKATFTTARAAPNSVVYHRVFPVLRMMLSKTVWMNRLWLACKTAAVHKLPDLKRNQAKAKLFETIITAKHPNAYQRFVPAL